MELGSKFKELLGAESVSIQKIERGSSSKSEIQNPKSKIAGGEV